MFSFYSYIFFVEEEGRVVYSSDVKLRELFKQYFYTQLKHCYEKSVTKNYIMD